MVKPFNKCSLFACATIVRFVDNFYDFELEHEKMIYFLFFCLRTVQIGTTAYGHLICECLKMCERKT